MKVQERFLKFASVSEAPFRRSGEKGSCPPQARRICREAPAGGWAVSEVILLEGCRLPFLSFILGFEAETAAEHLPLII